MRNAHRLPFRPRRILTTIICAGVAGLAAHHPAGGQQMDDGAPQPLIAFAASEASANRSALSTEGAAALKTIRSDPAASGLRIGHSVRAAIAAAVDARALSIVVPSASEASETSANAADARAPSSVAPSAPEASANAADALIAFTGVRVEHGDEGMVSLYARDDATDSEVALVVQGPDVLGSIRRGAAVYKVHPLGGGLTAVYRYDTSQLRRHSPSWRELMRMNRWMRGQALDAKPRDSPEASGAAADTGDVIDVLVAYTPAARAAAGNIDLFIQFAIDNTHRVYGNSRLGLRLRLVHKYQTSYTRDPSDMTKDLYRLTYASNDRVDGERPDPDGHMDEVHDLRDRYGADLVALIVGRSTRGACGMAWTPDFGMYPDFDWSESGFSVTAQNCETSTYRTFAHEIGHNQGAQPRSGQYVRATSVQASLFSDLHLPPRPLQRCPRLAHHHELRLEHPGSLPA